MFAIAGGDRDALGVLYDRHASAVTSVAARFGMSREAREDLVQDVFLQLWEKAADYDPERGTVLTWLVVRIRSRCLDRLRKSKRRAELLAENQDASLRPRELTPPGTRAVERSRLRTAVDDLDDELRQVTRMAYFDGLSTRSIAAELDIPRGTVKSRMRRAREALHAVLTGGAS